MKNNIVHQDTRHASKLSVAGSTILVVDDEQSTRTLIKTILEEDGCVIHEARNGIEALNYLEQNAPDLILLDTVMPGIDGYETCKRFMSNKVRNDIPIIFVSILEEVEKEAEGFRLGAVDYLTKPFNPATLKARVKTHLELKQHRDRLEEQNIKLIRVVSDSGQEIIERKRVEETLKETKAMLQAALDQSQAGIAIADAVSGKIQYVNKADIFLGGRREEESVTGIDIGRYVKSWQVLHFDGTLYKSDELPLTRAIKYGETCSKEFILRRSGDEDRIVWANAAPILNDEGKIIAGVVVFLDITKRKLAEKENEEHRHQLQCAFDQMSSLIQEVVTTQNIDLMFENSQLEKCYEKLNCDQEKCACYGQEPMRCWQIAGTFCGGEVQGAHAQKYGNCKMCDVFKDAASDPVNMIGEHFNNMMHILNIKHKELAGAYQALEHEIDTRKRAEEEQKKLIESLEDALSEIKTLRGIIPICSYCKNIRDDEGFWNKVDTYIQKHTEAQFSHGICPECYYKEMKKLDLEGSTSESRGRENHTHGLLRGG